LNVEFLPGLVLPAALLVMLTSLWLLISRRWRTSLLVLALQYVGVFVLTAYRWPLAMAAVKLVAGWMSLAMLGSAISSAIGSAIGSASWQSEERLWPSGRFFRLFLAVLMGMAIWAVAPNLESWLPGVDPALITGGAALIGMGLLHLGLTAHPLRVTAGLLTVLSGFEVLYAAVESSVLVAALLAAVNLGLALVGAYLLNLPAGEASS
jgi:hypothetical protein